MISKSVRKKMIAGRTAKEESFGRQIYYLYRFMVVWNENMWPKIDGLHLGPSHIHLLFTIGLDGVSNSEMARRAKVSKQAMSKLVQEILKYGLIEITVNDQDSRCNIITLTDKGAGVLVKIWDANKKMAEAFENRIGKVKAKRLLTLMAELVEALE